MESQHQKWVNLSYLAVAALVGYMVFTFSSQMVGAYDLESRVRSIDLVVRLLSIVAGAVLFFALFKNEKSNQFMNEVVVELTRVTWPSQKETTSATMIVIIMVLISGMILGLLDYVWTRVIQWVL